MAQAADAIVTAAVVVGGAAAPVIGKVRSANGQTDLPLELADALNEARKSSEVSAFPCIGMLVPVSPRAVAVLPPSATVPPARWPALQILAAGVRLALGSAVQSRGKRDALEEIHGLQELSGSSPQAI